MRVAKRLDLFRGHQTEMNMKLTKMREEGRDVINLGLGDPDVIPPQHLLDTMCEAVSNPNHHHYPSFYSNRPLKGDCRMVPAAVSGECRSEYRSHPPPRFQRRVVYHPPLLT